MRESDQRGTSLEGCQDPGPDKLDDLPVTHLCLFGCGLVVNSAPTRQSGLVPHKVHSAFARECFVRAHLTAWSVAPRVPRRRVCKVHQVITPRESRNLERSRCLLINLLLRNRATDWPSLEAGYFQDMASLRSTARRCHVNFTRPGTSSHRSHP